MSSGAAAAPADAMPPTLLVPRGRHCAGARHHSTPTELARTHNPSYGYPTLCCPPGCSTETAGMLFMRRLKPVASRALPRGGPHLHQPYRLVVSVGSISLCGGRYTTHCTYSPWLHVGRAAHPESTSAFVQTGIACSDVALNDQHHSCNLPLQIALLLARPVVEGTLLHAGCRAPVSLQLLQTLRRL
jgi:hypothetical protein